MKTFKRTVSCFLALLMIFSSFSVLSYAALEDSDNISSQIYTKYYVDGTEVTEVNAGDTVKARVYLATNFLLGTSEIFLVYPTDFLEFDEKSLTGAVDTGYGGTQYDAANAFNTTAGSTAASANLSGMVVQQDGVTIDSYSAADDMIYEGYFTEEYFDDKGWIWLNIQGGTPTVFTPDAEYVADDWIAEFTFTVKDTATADGKGYLHVPAASLTNPTDHSYGKTAVQRAMSATDFGSIAAYDIEYNMDVSKDTYTIKLAAPEATKYAVSYSFAGDVPDGYDSKVPTATEAEEGDIISAPTVEIPEGYELTWTATGATLNADGTYTVGAGAVAFLGTWKKKAPTTYDVTYSYANEAPAGAAAAPAAGKTTAGATIAAPSTDAPDGYTLTWAVTGATKNDDGSYTAGANDVEFVGTWSKIEYDVTYSYANEAPAGAAAAPAAGKTTVGATIAAPSENAPDGWTLTWAATGATKNADGSYTAGANDVEFVGTWAKIDYAVTYSFANEGPENADALKPADGTTTVGATIAAPATNLVAGWTVTWEATGATKNADGSYTAGAGDVEFVGTWAKNVYNVTYSFANEGPEGVDVPANTTTTVGEVINPGITAPAGWIFRWNVTGATSNGDGTFTAGANDVEFVGNWTKKTYSVTYSFANEGPQGVNAPAPGSTSVGEVITPAVDVPAGWALTWAATNATDNGDGSYTAAANDVSFVGTWSKLSYTITYYLSEQDQADGKVYDTQTVTFGDAVTAIADPKVDGKIFDAWDLDFPATMPAKNLEAVAIFTPIVVTFLDVYGDPIIDYTMEYATEITDADLPTEDDAKAGEDVNFVEWQIDGVKLETPYALEDSVEVYAYCTVDIVYYADEEMTEVYETLTVDFGHIITEEDIANLGEPSKTGYEFDAWEWDFTDSEAFQNTYTYAIYTANTYTATFTAGDGAFAEGTVTTVNAKFDDPIEFTAEPVLEGYTFQGWTDVEGGEVLDELVMDEEGKIFYPVFEMNDFAFFSVELYLMNTEGKYEETPSKTTRENGLIGLTVTVDHDGWQQYIDDWFSADTSEEAGNVYTGVIAEDGSTVLKLYYKRAQYEVAIFGENVFDLYHGATITAPETSWITPDGYVLKDWNNGEYAKGEVITITGPLTLTPNFVAGTSEYTINTYTMGLDGEYGAAVSETKEYTTDKFVYYTAPVVEGFTADKDRYSTLVEGDGKAEINVYYVRNQYDVVIDGAEAVKVYYEAEITAPETSTATPAGYVLESWNDGAIAKGEKIKVTGPLTLAPTFTAGTSEYTINTYTMGLDGEYGAAVSETKTATTDAEVTYTAPVVEGFKADKESYTVKVTGDGKAEINVYYDRNTYEVVIDGAKDQVYYGATITAPETVIAAPEGYHLVSWNDGAYAMGQEITVTGPVTLTPDYAPNADTAYTVEIYLMDENGNYAETADDTDVLAGTTDTLATAAHADYAQEAWFTPAADGNVTEATITGDGKAVLKLYFERAQYDVTIDGVATKVYHGATINAPETTTQTAPAGYAFAGWNNGTIAAGAPITVTEAMELVPYFAEGAANYTVEIYLQNADGTYDAVATDSKTVAGTTGADVAVAHADYAQADYYLADDAQANVFEGTIAGDGSLVLKLYFKRATYDIIVDGNVVAEDVIHGAEVTLPETSDNITEGNELAGWTDGVKTYEPGETIIVDGAIDLVPIEKPSDATKYTISIYVMDVNGEYVGTSTVAYGTTGATQTLVADYGREGFTVDTAKSNLTDTIKGDGSTVLSVYYARNLYKATFDGVEYQVYYGASLPEVEPAAQVGQKFVAWTPEVPTTMPAEDLEFTSTWTADMYKIIYIINGTEEEYEYAAGAAVTPIADPVVPGMTFIKWNKTIPTVMPAEDVIIVAEFEAAVFKVTFLDGDGKVFDEKAVQYGDTIVLPASNPTKDNHVFKGWLDVPETMPASNVTIYPDFERVPVRLVAAEGSTTVIDRSTMIITGLTTKMNDNKKDNYLAVEGDGYYTITPAEGYTGFYGTGSKVEVYDNADTSAPVETFYVVIYGDVNGDSAVNSADNSIVENEVLFATNWSRGDTKNELMFMAADLNKDGKVKQGDADGIMNSTLGIAKIDQATGNVIR